MAAAVAGRPRPAAPPRLAELLYIAMVVHRPTFAGNEALIRVAKTRFARGRITIIDERREGNALMTLKELEEMIAGELARLIEAGQPVTVEALTGKILPFVAVDRKLAAFLMFIGLEVLVSENLLAPSASAARTEQRP